MTSDPHFLKALKRHPDRRTLQDLQIIYYGLQSLEALYTYRDSSLRTLCKTVKYERHEANDVLYFTGELAMCWYVLLSGSVFIDGKLFLPTSSVQYPGRENGPAYDIRSFVAFPAKFSSWLVHDK
ncbi:rap guanine nucleotide exchange factor-like [Sipha flava]|uniref:Rap guanine nucleotide exchange factor-like n=1 Tax=Sipha flava TaxID=143950 RepID=A0A8B8GB89_9HEMI|nr:rap guanine nucleotide exchange factor-like [Sipha flava]